MSTLESIRHAAPRPLRIDRGIAKRWREHSAERKRGRLVSRRSRRMLAQWLRRTANRGCDPHQLRRCQQVLLGDRVAAVRADLLEIAAMLEQALDPDPERLAALHDLLANGCDSPLYNSDVHVSELRATLHYVRSGLEPRVPTQRTSAVRSKWLGVASAVTVVVALGASASAVAARDSVVVPPGGTVAGMGYGGWLALSWQLALRSHPPGPGACETVVTADGPVAVLFQSFAGGKQAYTCNEPAGRPIYVVGISNECSSLPGDHPGFDDTPAQLEACAPHGFDGAFGTASVDGRPVDDYRALISRTTVFTIHLPKNNLFDSKERTGRSAAFGEGLLLRGLSTGTHSIHTTSVVPSVFSAEVTYTLHIH